jgi:hypothetical protein
VVLNKIAQSLQPLVVAAVTRAAQAQAEVVAPVRMEVTEVVHQLAQVAQVSAIQLLTAQ